MVAQYFAQLDADNTVLDLHVVTAEFMLENPQRYPGVWVETFFNDPNKTYAAIGYIFDAVTNDFIAPIPVE